MLGVLLVEKPQGLTSHDAVNVVRERFGIKRVGHSGSLDPLATGLLVMAVGPATRFLQYLPLEPKGYVATFEFGRSTTTQDCLGETVEERPSPENLSQWLAEALPRYLGKIDQIPPMYSAIKREGRPLYAYARKGEVIERESRSVYIEKIEILSASQESATLNIVCSGGTYIRTLGHDMGEDLGCGAHMTALHRTQVGRFSVDQASPLDEAKPEDLIPLESALPPTPTLQLSPLDIERVSHGNVIQAEAPLTSTIVALLDENGRVFSMARALEGNRLQPECVIPREQSHGEL